MTPERLARALALMPEAAMAKVTGWHVQPRWTGQGAVFWYRTRTPAGLRFRLVDPETGAHGDAFDHDALALDLRRATGEPTATAELPFAEITVSPGGIAFDHGGVRWLLAPDGALRHAPPAPDPAALPAPCGTRSVVLREHDLWLTGDGAPPRRLTHDGVPRYGYGEEPGGSMLALTEGHAPRPAAQWSPCGRWLLIFRCDERAVQDLPILEFAPRPGQRPRLHRLPVPLAGDEVTATGAYCVINTRTGAVVPVDIPPFPAMESPFWFAAQGMEAARHWSRDGALHLTRRSAGGRRQTLYRVDPATGAATPLIIEESDIPVLLNPFEFQRPNWHVIDGTGEILWWSEGTGHGQLTLHDSDGVQLNLVGPGAHVVRDVLNVDEEARTVLFTASALPGSSNPYHRKLLVAPLGGGPARVLTPEEGDHDLSLSPDKRWLVDAFGDPDLPCRSVLRDLSGAIAMTLETADDSGLRAAGFRSGTSVQTLAADGVTQLHGMLFLPPDFDPGASYPVIDAIYGGPQLTVTPHGHLLDTGAPLTGGLEIALENHFLPVATVVFQTFARPDVA